MWWVALDVIGRILRRLIVVVVVLLVRSWERFVAGAIGATLAYLSYSVLLQMPNTPLPKSPVFAVLFVGVMTLVGFMIGFSMGSGFITGQGNTGQNQRR